KLLDRQERERNQEIASDHRPKKRRVRSALRKPEDSHLPRFVAVPRGEALGEHEVDPKQAHHEQKFSKILEVYGEQVFLEVQELAQQRHGNDERGDAAEDGTGDEIRG